MAALFSFPYLLGFPILPTRRVIAIDAGSHSIKILLAEKAGNSVRIVRRQIINLHEEGLLSPEEIGPPLRSILATLGDYPVVLALPQHLPLAHILDLQSEGAKGVKQLIEAETHKNRDLRDSAVVYDCARLRPFGKHQNSFLVTLCKENDILQQITRLSVPEEDICEVVSSANVLATAYRRIGRLEEPAALVDIGASGTLVTLFVAGQGVHAATFPIGGNLITETIAAQKVCSIDAAETLKQTKNLFSGPDELPPLRTLIQGWRIEIERILQEWLRENPELKLSPAAFRMIISGGCASQPGLLQHLNSSSGLEFLFRPGDSSLGGEPLPKQFAIASGTALHALATTPQSASLLPAKLRDEWRNRRVHQNVLTAVFVLLFATMLLLVAGTWQKISAKERKEMLLAEAEVAIEKAENTEALKRELANKYERLWPVLRRQQQTLDTLNTLWLLEQSRTNRNLWYVLFADQLSYFSRPATPVISSRGTLAASTNVAMPRNGFVAELCLNQEGEAMRQTLGQVVGELKQSALFSNVDTLPSDLRRDMSKTNVILPDRHFALSLELVADEFVPFAATDKSPVTNGIPVTPPVREPIRSNAPRQGSF